MSTSRRTLFAQIPAGLTALGGFAPLAANAFRLEAPSAMIAAEYGAACPAPGTHDALRVALEQLFEGRPLPPVLAPELSSLARCPFCGCGVAGAADHGEREG